MKLIDGFEFFSGFDAETEIKERYTELLENGYPLFLKHEKKVDSIVVCLAGIGATSFESRPIADACFKLGIDAVCPLLPGHGFKDLKKGQKLMATIKWTTWVKAINEEVRKANEKYKNVFIYGQSLGGCVAYAVAEEGHVKAVATTVPAIKIPWVSGLLWVLGWINMFFWRKNKETVSRNVSYPFENLRAFRQTLFLSRHTRKNLHKITCPVLHCHSKKDMLIKPKSAYLVKEKVTGLVEIEWFNTKHTMPLDVNEGKLVSQTIAKFLKKQVELQK